MRHYLTALAILTLTTPVIACYAGEGNPGNSVRDRALGDGGDGFAPAPGTVELLNELPGYYVLAEGAASDGALASLWLGAGEMTSGAKAGESRTRAADCDATSCDFVVADSYRALPPEMSINEAYLLLDADQESPSAFYAVEHVARDASGEIAALHLRYAPSADQAPGEPFVLTRWGGPEIRPDTQIDTMDALPGHYAREGAAPVEGEVVDVQFGPYDTGEQGEVAGSFIRQIASSCAGTECDVERGERYLAVPEPLGIGASHITFETGGGQEDTYIVDEIARDEQGTIVRLALRHWGEYDFGEPFSLARFGYGEN